MTYIVRHWRGELSLPVSYWLNGFLANLAGYAAIGAVVATASNARNMFVPLISLASMWGALLVISVWQVGGIWRSASRYALEKPGSGWSYIAKGMVILGTLSVLGNVNTYAIPQLTDAFWSASGDPSQGKRGVRILRDGAEIEISGYFARGLADDFRDALARSPGARLVHIDSPGGRFGVAIEIRDSITERGLDTIVVKKCASACTIAFLAGRQRWVTRDAKLGFHQGVFGGHAYSCSGAQS